MSEKMKAQDKPNVKAFHLKKKPFSGLFLKTILNQQDRRKIFSQREKIRKKEGRTFRQRREGRPQQAASIAKPLKKTVTSQYCERHKGP
jgi:hypothetical protein